MAYTNSVGIMPGAATEKLPFVHSDFKPRSKFAKCFGGFKKFTKQGNVDERSYYGQKLPLIHYSVSNQRNLIALGKNDQGETSEYPGFAGKKKLLKKKCHNSSTGVHPAISGAFTRRQANAMKHYLSLPNLNTIHQHPDACTLHNLHNEGRQRHRPKDNGDDDLIKYLQHQQQNQQQNNESNMKNMDSLFIIDDDDDESPLSLQQHNNAVIVGSSVRIKHPTSSPQNGSFHRGSPVASGNNVSFLDEIDMMDPFAREVGRKLQEARGKSGMKRDRRRESDHTRILGDIVTAERMHELLLPRKSEGPLEFTENV